jgi:hypothetical protein
MGKINPWTTLGLTAPEIGGLEKKWSEFLPADRVRLLTEGKTMLNGKLFSLDGALVRWDLTTTNDYDQTGTTYAKYGETAGYKREGKENGVAYTQNWSAAGFDRHGRATGFKDVMARQGQATLTTTRDKIVYDDRSLAGSYQDTLTSSASPDLVTKTQAKVTYDALKRQKTSIQTVTQNGKTAKGEILDAVQTVVTDNYTYNNFDKATGYDEAKFQGTTLKLGDTQRSWESLDEDEKADLLSGKVKPDDQLLNLARVSGVAYNAQGLQIASINTTRDLGQSLIKVEKYDEMAPVTIPAPPATERTEATVRSAGGLESTRAVESDGTIVETRVHPLENGALVTNGTTTSPNGKVSHWTTTTNLDGTIELGNTGPIGQKSGSAVDVMNSLVLPSTFENVGNPDIFVGNTRLTLDDGMILEIESKVMDVIAGRGRSMWNWWNSDMNGAEVKGEIKGSDGTAGKEWIFTTNGDIFEAKLGSIYLTGSINDFLKGEGTIRGKSDVSSYVVEGQDTPYLNANSFNKLWHFEQVTFDMDLTSGVTSVRYFETECTHWAFHSTVHYNEDLIKFFGKPKYTKDINSLEGENAVQKLIPFGMFRMATNAVEGSLIAIGRGSPTTAKYLGSATNSYQATRGDGTTIKSTVNRKSDGSVETRGSAKTKEGTQSEWVLVEKDRALHARMVWADGTVVEYGTDPNSYWNITGKMTSKNGSVTEFTFNDHFNGSTTKIMPDGSHIRTFVEKNSNGSGTVTTYTHVTDINGWAISGTKTDYTPAINGAGATWKWDTTTYSPDRGRQIGWAEKMPDGTVRSSWSMTLEEGGTSRGTSVVNPDGSSTTQVRNSDGSVTDTSTRFGLNGKLESRVRTTLVAGDKGYVLDSVVTKNPDGSSTENSHRVNNDGTIVDSTKTIQGGTSLIHPSREQTKTTYKDGSTEETTTTTMGDGSSVTRGRTTSKAGTVINWLMTVDNNGKTTMARDSYTDASAAVVTSRAEYNALNQQVGRVEVAWDEKAPGQIVTTTLKDIKFNDLGQQTGYTSDLKKLGVDLELFEKIIREGMVYNTLGQLTGYTDNHIQNGLNTTTTMMGITYNSKGLMNGSTGIVHKEGQEPRLVYFDPTTGRELTGGEIAALLSAHPKKTVKDLVRENILKAETKIFQVNETVKTVTSGIKYDRLNRVNYSMETVTNADHTQTVNVISQMEYDRQGRLVGSDTETRVTGNVGQLVYQLKGLELSATTLRDLLESESKKTGKTANDIFWALFRAGDLKAVEVVTPMDRTSSNRRSGILYNANGQMSHYEDTLSDPDNNVLEQVTKVDLEYNRRGQMLTQKSSVHADMKGAGWSDSASTMTMSYDDRTGLLLGATTVSNSITQPRKEWTDTDRDGRVDHLVLPPQVKGKSEQHFGVFNGTLQLTDQTSSQESWGIEVPGKTFNKNENTMVFIYNSLGRALGAISTGTSETNDGYDNVTRGTSIQLFVTVNGEQRVQASLSDTNGNNADGSDSHTVMVNLTSHDNQARVTGADGKGYTSGNEVGTIDPEHTWTDGWVDANRNGIVEDSEVDRTRADGKRDASEVAWVDTNKDGIEQAAKIGRVGVSNGSISQEFKVIDNEARLIKNTATTHNTSESGSTTDQTLETSYQYDSAGRLTGGSAKGATGASNKDWSDGPPKALVESSKAEGTITQQFVVINGSLKIKNSRSISETTLSNDNTQTQDLIVAYTYDDRGNTLTARGIGITGSVERGWTDTSVPLDGIGDVFVVVGRQTGVITQDYSVVNNRACLVFSRNVSTTLDPDTKAPLREGDDLFRKTTSDVRYVVDALGRTVAASGVSSMDGTTQQDTILSSGAGAEQFFRRRWRPPLDPRRYSCRKGRLI